MPDSFSTNESAAMLAVVRARFESRHTHAGYVRDPHLVQSRKCEPRHVLQASRSLLGHDLYERLRRMLGRRGVQIP